MAHITISRRAMLAGVAATAAFASVSPAGAAQEAKAAPMVPPREALKRLKDGNAAFLRGELPPLASISGRRRLEVARSQHPFATLIGCSDSRVPPEELFHRGLGELFVIRVAGNTVDTVELGSVEYSIVELNVPLVVVMGHERCGAVKAAVEVVERNSDFPDAIGRLVEPIVPAVLRARADGGPDLLDASVRANVRRVVAHLRGQASPTIVDPYKAGRLMIVGAYYDLDTGAVTFFET